MRLIENLSILSLKDFLRTPRNWDVFIACGSFEARCTRSSDIFIDKKVEIENNVIWHKHCAL